MSSVSGSQSNLRNGTPVGSLSVGFARDIVALGTLFRITKKKTHEAWKERGKIEKTVLLLWATNCVMGFLTRSIVRGGAGVRSRLAKLPSASQPAEGLGASRGVHTLY